MGTNHYLLIDPCPTCGHTDKRYHIGKSSGGWCFALHVFSPDYDDEIEAHSLDDWIQLWSGPLSVIEDEYGDNVSTDEMLKIITALS